MSERYKKLYRLEHRLYADGAPLLVEDGALLLDAASNAMLCQLCFRNIQSRPIKSLRAYIQPLDERGAPLGKPVDHRYLDLDLKREEEYGRDTAVVLPARDARSFSLRLSQISFADGEVWTDEDVLWLPLPDQLSLEEYCGDDKEAERFRRRFGKESRMAPLQTETLWFCSCGAVNHPEETRCHRCRLRQGLLLEKSGGARSPEDENEAEELEAERPFRAEPAQRKRWIAAVVGFAAVLLVGLFLLLPRFTGGERAEKAAYSRAKALLEQGDWDAAEAAFTDLGDYRDSADYLEQEIPYRRAIALQEAGELEEAENAFAALGDYEDSAARAEACRQEIEDRRLAGLRARYSDAKALLEAGRYAEAREAFLALGEFEDSEELAREALYRRAAGLYAFVEKHEISGIYASQGEAEQTFVLSREKALSLGSRGLAELRSTCGEDPVRLEIRKEPEPTLLTLDEALSLQLEELGDYRDSAALAAALPELADHSEEFFRLCARGDLAAAKEWLLSEQGRFEDRERWLVLLEKYLPYCREWALNSGDPSLIPMIEGDPSSCDSMRTLVLLSEEGATLRFLLREGDEAGPELTAELGETRFLLHTGKMSYLAEISNSGSLAVNKLNELGFQGGVEYLPK